MSLEQHECGSHVVKAPAGYLNSCGRRAIGAELRTDGEWSFGWRGMRRGCLGFIRGCLGFIRGCLGFIMPRQRGRLIGHDGPADRNLTNRDDPEWKPHNGYSARFSQYIVRAGNITSIFLIPDCGAPGTERVWLSAADGSRSPLAAMTAGQWRPAGISDAVASGSLILSGGAMRDGLASAYRRGEKP